MTVTIGLHIHGIPAVVRDLRGGEGSHVGLHIGDGTGNVAVVYFASKAALTLWLADALGAAVELPADMPVVATHEQSVATGAKLASGEDGADGSGAPTTPPTPSPDAQTDDYAGTPV